VSVSLIEKLVAEPVPTTAARRAKGATAAPGFYAWWLTNARALPGVPATPHPTRPLWLAYIGIAPRNTTSRETVRSRVLTKHLGRALGSSTLRRALAAVMWEGQGWRPFMKGEKPAFSDDDCDALTRWMGSHLEVSWCVTNEPWRYEPELIHEMQPPLNSEHNHNHPFYPTLRQLRIDFLATARRNGPSV
jgi:hypothetical protein